jgi:hypothetical protein
MVRIANVIAFAAALIAAFTTLAVRAQTMYVYYGNNSKCPTVIETSNCPAGTTGSYYYTGVDTCSGYLWHHQIHACCSFEQWNFDCFNTNGTNPDYYQGFEEKYKCTSWPANCQAGSCLAPQPPPPLQQV